MTGLDEFFPALCQPLLASTPTTHPQEWDKTNPWHSGFALPGSIEPLRPIPQCLTQSGPGSAPNLLDSRVALRSEWRIQVTYRLNCTRSRARRPRRGRFDLRPSQSRHRAPGNGAQNQSPGSPQGKSVPENLDHLLRGSGARPRSQRKRCSSFLFDQWPGRDAHLDNRPTNCRRRAVALPATRRRAPPPQFAGNAEAHGRLCVVPRIGMATIKPGNLTIRSLRGEQKLNGGP